MMLHGAQFSPRPHPSVSGSPSLGSPATIIPLATTPAPTSTPTGSRMRRKRKAESQDNERLSKRLSLLNIEQHGSRLYVPVETPSIQTTRSDAGLPTRLKSTSKSKPQSQDDDMMQVDDTKHKVYIYNIDDELSSDSESDDGKLVFLPDIEKHLKANRIPPSVLANKDGELAGMQLVLYSDPKSLSVPEEKDSVRKAIIESRHRTREQQRLERERETAMAASPGSTIAVGNLLPGDDPDAMDVD